jgi:hypothetical protein
VIGNHEIEWIELGVRHFDEQDARRLDVASRARFR